MTARHSEIAVAGVHGGAGVTTLAALLGSALDLGVVPRHSRNWLRDRVDRRPLVLVSRSTLVAARSASAAINVIREQGGTVAALAVVSDGLPEPKPVTYRFQIMSEQVSGLVRIPFVSALRSTDDPARVALPKAALRTLTQLRELAQARADGRQSVPQEGA